MSRQASHGIGLPRIGLRGRLTLWYGMLVLLVILGFTTFAYLEMRSALYQGVDSAIVSRSAQVASSTTLTSVGAQYQADAAPNGIGDGAVFIYDRLGRLLEPTIGTPQLDLHSDPQAALKAARGQTVWTSTQDNLRIYTAPVHDDAGQPFIIQIVGSREAADDALRQVLSALLLSVPLLVLISGAGGAFLAGRALRPIDRITWTARKIGAGDLHERLDLPARDDEVGRLASTFDEMLDRLERAFLRQRQFTADASHELRTPLTVLQGEVDIALRRRRAPEEYEAALHTIQGRVGQMTGLVEDLLALARADSGHVDIDREIVELDDVARRAATHCETLFTAKGLSLTLALEPHVIVIGDHGRLFQMVVNLLNNAARYTDRGGVRVELTTTSDTATLAVADSGIGIPPEHLDRIFERFYRVDKARSRAEGGTGIGLAIAQSVATAHGGTIEATSTVGRGSVFRAILPLAPHDEQGHQNHAMTGWSDAIANTHA